MVLEDRLYLYVLTLLYISGSMSFVDLQKELEKLGIKVTKGNLQHHLERLKEEGLVEKRYIPFFLSRRKVIYRITDDGARTLTEFFKEVNSLERLVSDISSCRCIYFPYDGLWERLINESKRKKVEVHELLKEIIEWYFSAKGEGNE